MIRQMMPLWRPKAKRKLTVVFILWYCWRIYPKHMQMVSTVVDLENCNCKVQQRDGNRFSQGGITSHRKGWRVRWEGCLLQYHSSNVYYYYGTIEVGLAGSWEEAGGQLLQWGVNCPPLLSYRSSPVYQYSQLKFILFMSVFYVCRLVIELCMDKKSKLEVHFLLWWLVLFVAASLALFFLSSNIQFSFSSFFHVVLSNTTLLLTIAIV